MLHLLLSTSLLIAQAPRGASLPPPRPFETDIRDPMLAPAARPRRELTNWSEAVGLAFAHAPDERRAEAGIERAEGRWRQALAALLPNARLTGQLAVDLLHPDTPPPAAGVGFGLGAAPGSVPLGTASATASQALVDVAAWRGLEAGRAARRSAESRRLDVRRRITWGTARGIVAVVAAERAAELNRLGLRQALERVALTERSRELGAATELDATRVRQDVEVARGTLVAGDEQLRRTREALGAGLGQRHDVGVRTGFDLDGLVTETRRRCTPIATPEARTDLEAARADLEAARASRRQAASGYLPTLGVASTLAGYTTHPGFGRFSSWSIAAVLSVPLWEGGGRAGLVRERAGIERETAAALQEVEQDVAFEVAQSRRAVRVAGELLASAREARALAERTDRMTRLSFEAGRSGSLELVQSAAALRQADLLLAAREYELVQARLDALMTETRCEL